MARFRKPFFRDSRKLWYVQIDGRQINLGPEREEAFRRYGELMWRPRTPKLTSDSVAVLLDLFLDWCKLHREPRTYEWYQMRCQGFLDSIPAALSVRELKSFHVQRWVDGKLEWNGGMKRGAMIAIKRAFNWLSKQGHIDRSPLPGLELPPAGRRERVVTAVEHAAMVARYDGDPFGDLLELAWETGARAQELWNIEARHVAFNRWVFPAKEAKGKRRVRVVHLTPKALLITQRLMLKYPEGKLLRNQDGVPWTRQAVSCRFLRLKQVIGEKLCLTNWRHSYATRMIENGVDSILVAAAMGHRDLSMIGKVYAHPSLDVVSSAVAKLSA